MDTKYLKHRRHSGRFYFQIAVPLHLQSRLGKTIIRSLKTTDLRTAQKRRDEMLVETRRSFEALEPEAQPWTCPENIVSGAQQLRAAVAIGQLTHEQAMEAFERELLTIAEQQYPPLSIPAGPTATALQRGHGIVEGSEQGLTLKVALGQHLDAVETTLRPQTRNRRRQRVEAFIAHLGDLPLAQVTGEHVSDFILSKLKPAAQSVKTKRDHVGDLSAFFTWCEIAGKIPVNPAKGKSRLLAEAKVGIEKAGRRAWDDGEVVQLLENMERDLRPGDYLFPLVRVALSSGLRIEEICQIRGRDIEQDCFVVRQAKNDNSLRRVPVHSSLRDLTDGLKLDAYLIPGLTPGGPNKTLSYRASKKFSHWKSKWCFDGELVFHGLRRSFATKLQQAGVALETAERLLGHRTQSMTYGHYSAGLDVAELRRAVEMVAYR